MFIADVRKAKQIQSTWKKRFFFVGFRLYFKDRSAAKFVLKVPFSQLIFIEKI